MLRLLIAFVAAPFLPACLRNLLLSGGQFQTSALGALVETAYLLLFAVPLGLALFGVAWKFGKIQWYWAAAAGALVGLIFFVPVVLPTLADVRLRDWKKIEALTELGTVVVYCTGVALLTWVLGVWRNPALWRKLRRVGGVAV
jgi:hypothetical protein